MSESDNPHPSTNGDGRLKAALPDGQCADCNQTIAHRHVCERCGRAFCSVDCLRRHVATHTTDPSSSNVAVPVVAGALAALVGGLFLWIFLTAQPMGQANTGPEAFEALKPAVSLSAGQFMGQYIRGPKGTEASYFDRVVQLEGEVENTYPQRSPALLVLKGVEGPKRRVVECSMRRGVDVAELKPGTPVIVRGVFRGRDQSTVAEDGVVLLVLIDALYRPAPEPAKAP